MHRRLKRKMQAKPRRKAIMTIKRNFAAGTALVLIVSGCTPNDITMGATVRHNKEVQIVDPEPKYAEAQTADGSKVAGAQERYRTDRVKKAKSIRTTESGSAGRAGN
jgi:hypothetical protein